MGYVLLEILRKVAKGDLFAKSSTEESARQNILRYIYIISTLTLLTSELQYAGFQETLYVQFFY